MEADELEDARREHAPRSLRLEVSLLHEPGGECGAGQHGGKDGCD
jgi:hypothetical protein